MGIKITSPNLKDPIYISWRDREFLSGYNILTKFSKIQQSATSSNLLGAPFSLEISSRVGIFGGSNNKNDSLLLKNGIFTNQSTDNLCLFRASLMALIGSSPDPFCHNSRNAKTIGLGKDPKGAFKRLLKDCHLEGERFELSIYAPRIENHFNRNYSYNAPYQLVVISSRQIKDEWLYPPREKCYDEIPKTHLILQLMDGHYSTVWTPTKYFNVGAICYGCRKGMDRLSRHGITCKYKCKFCNQPKLIIPCQNEDFEQKCTECNTLFRNRQCFNDHLNATCHLFKVCQDCNVRFNVRYSHKCEYKFCRKCHAIHANGRPCFLTPLTKTKDSQKYKLIVFE